MIGGASLFGGQGTVVGTLIGAFLIALIRNGAVLLNINQYYQMVVIGVIIWLAVFWDQLPAPRCQRRASVQEGGTMRCRLGRQSLWPRRERSAAGRAAAEG